MYKIEILSKPIARISATDINLRMENSFTVLVRGADEELRQPLNHLKISVYMRRRAEEIVKNAKFKPEYVVNMQKLSFTENSLAISANYVNYGSVVAVRALAKEFPDQILPIMDKVAPIGVNGVLLSRKDSLLYIARRANVTSSGTWHVYPAGTVSENQNIETALRKEAMEEASFQTSEYQFDLVGIMRGRIHGPNPALVFVTEINFPYEMLKKMTRPEEHDKVMGIPADPMQLKIFLEKIIFEKAVDNEGERLIINDQGLGSLILVGRSLFGEVWYENLKDISSEKPSRFMLEESNAFRKV